MNRNVWFGTLVLGLCGSLSLATAQVTVWRPVKRPDVSTPPPVVRATSHSLPGASLGRPIAANASSKLEPRRFPDMYRNEVAITSPLRRGVEPIATVPGPTSVIATSSSNTVASIPQPVGPPEEIEEIHGDLFAVERMNHLEKVAPPSVTPTFVDPNPPGNWKKPFSIAPPDPVATQVVIAPDGPVLIPGNPDGPLTWTYVRGEYLLWWTKNDKAPPLVTTGSPVDANGNPNQNAGSLSDPTTVVLFDGKLDRNPFSGGRLTVGCFLDDSGCKAIELSGFFLGSKNAGFEASSAFFPVLARPFFDTQAGAESRELVAFPGLASGSVRVDAPSQLWGMELNTLCKCCCGCNYRVDVLGGVRYLDLRESLTITESLLSSANAPRFPNQTILVQDRFATTNQFYGGQIGVQGGYQMGRFSVDGRAKLAVGVTRQEVKIDGFQAIGSGERFVGGLLALQSNIGTFSRDRFTLVPEVGVSIGYHVTDNIRASIGYNFLYWSSVARPGDQVDRNLDPNLIPNFLQAPVAGGVAGRPAVLFKDTDYWAQGLTAGLEFRF